MTHGSTFYRMARVIKLVYGAGGVIIGIWAIMESLLRPSSLSLPFSEYPWLGVLLGVVFILSGVATWFLTWSQILWCSFLAGPAGLLHGRDRPNYSARNVDVSEAEMSDGDRDEKNGP